VEDDDARPVAGASGRTLEHRWQVVDAIAPHDLWRIVVGSLERAAQAIEAGEVVGPDAGEQPARVALVVRVEG
jgi:hypothetical protein